MSNQLFNETGLLPPLAHASGYEGITSAIVVKNLTAARVRGEIVRLTLGTDGTGLSATHDFTKNPHAGFRSCETVIAPTSAAYRANTLYGVCMDTAAIGADVVVGLRGSMLMYTQAFTADPLNKTTGSLLVTGTGVADASNPTGGNLGVLTSDLALTTGEVAKAVGMFLAETTVTTNNLASLQPVIFDGISGFGMIKVP